MSNFDTSDNNRVITIESDVAINKLDIAQNAAKVEAVDYRNYVKDTQINFVDAGCNIVNGSVGMAISLSQGSDIKNRFYIQGQLNEKDDTVDILTLVNGEAQQRIDLIVVRLDQSLRIIKGAQGAATADYSGVLASELAIAEITVPAGITAIANATILDVRSLYASVSKLPDNYAHGKQIELIRDFGGYTAGLYYFAKSTNGYVRISSPGESNVSVTGAGNAGYLAQFSDDDTIVKSPVLVTGNNISVAGNVNVTGGTINTTAIALQFHLNSVLKFYYQGSALSVIGSIIADTVSMPTTGRLQIGNNANIIKTASADTDIQIGNGAQTTKVSLYTASGIGMYIDATKAIFSSVNVGIGNTSPLEKLHVGGTIGLSGGGTSFVTGRVYPLIYSSNVGGTGPFVANGNLIIQARGDTNSTITFATGIGVNTAMTIDGSQNVGIGTTLPLSKLDVLSTLTNTVGGGGLTLSDGGIKYANFRLDGSGGFNLDLYNGGSYNSISIARTTNIITFNKPSGLKRHQFDSLGSGNYGLYNNSEVRTVLINTLGDSYFNGGNVGIGTLTPSNKLMVVETLSGLATMRLLNNHGSGFAGTEYMKNDGSTVGAYVGLESNGLSFKINTIGQNLIIPNGNVGIGITSPQNLLHLNRTTASTVVTHYTNLSTGVTTSDGMIVGIDSTGLATIWSYENKDMRFGTNSTENIRILANGNVGIGTTAPLSKLHTYNTTGNTSHKIEATSGNYAFTSIQSGSTFWDIAVNNTLVNVNEGQTRLEFRKSGGGAHRISIDDGFIGIYGNSVRNVFLNANGNSYFNGGNLGIGTVAPAEKLDVNGNIKMGTNPTLSWISNSLSLVSATDAISVVQVKGTPSFNPRFEVWDANNVNQIVNLTAGTSWINANFGIGANNVPKSKLDVRGDFQTIIGAGYGAASDNIHTFMSAGADANNNGFIKGYGFKITTTASTLDDAKFSIGYNTAYNVTHEYPTTLTEVMTFDRDKVGIDTTTPLSRLHIGNITSNPTNLTIQALSGSQKTIIYMSGVTTKWVVGMHSIGSLNNDWNIGTAHNVSNFVVKANGDIHTNGNITITQGTSDNKLQINSDINMKGDLYKQGVKLKLNFEIIEGPSYTSPEIDTLSGAINSGVLYSDGVILDSNTYALTAQNTSDTSTSELLVLYDLTTKTITSTHNILSRPKILIDTRTGKPIVHNNDYLIVEGQPFSGGGVSTNVARMNKNTKVTTLYSVSAVINGANHAFDTYAYQNGNVVYLVQMYRDNAVAPGSNIVKWDLNANTFTNVDYTAIITSTFNATASTRIERILPTQNDAEILLQLWDGISTIIVFASTTTTTLGSSSIVGIGRYDTIVANGKITCVPRGTTGDSTKMILAEYNIGSAISASVSIHMGSALNLQRTEGRQLGFYRRGVHPVTHEEIFIASSTSAVGNTASDQYITFVDLVSRNFGFLSLDGSPYLGALSDNLLDIPIYTGIDFIDGEGIICIAHWRDASGNSNNSTWERNGSKIFMKELI